MTYVLKTFSGETFSFARPEMVKLSVESNTPAHSLQIRVPLTAEEGQALPEYHTLELYKEGRQYFCGLVDEQLMAVSAEGISLTIYARSMAALLLDNEAVPQNYYTPSSRLIYQRHAQPYGFSPFSGTDKIFSGKLQVEKGFSEWEVIETFCQDYLGTRPQVSLTGELFLEPNAPAEEQIFSNQSGVPWTSFSQRSLRCRRISQVWVRAESMGSYSVKVSSEKTMEEGICRRRLWNNVGDGQTPVFRGQQILRKSREESYEISLVCPGEWVLEPGTPARINDGLLGTQKNLRVDKVVYLLDQSGERTEILLRKTEEE